jgi:hypothetical protein
MSVQKTRKKMRSLFGIDQGGVYLDELRIEFPSRRLAMLSSSAEPSDSDDLSLHRMASLNSSLTMRNSRGADHQQLMRCPETTGLEFRRTNAEDSVADTLCFAENEAHLPSFVSLLRSHNNVPRASYSFQRVVGQSRRTVAKIL